MNIYGLQFKNKKTFLNEKNKIIKYIESEYREIYSFIYALDTNKAFVEKKYGVKAEDNIEAYISYVFETKKNSFLKNYYDVFYIDFIINLIRNDGGISNCLKKMKTDYKIKYNTMESPFLKFKYETKTQTIVCAFNYDFSYLKDDLNQTVYSKKRSLKFVKLVLYNNEYYQNKSDNTTIIERMINNIIPLNIKISKMKKL